MPEPAIVFSAPEVSASFEPPPIPHATLSAIHAMTRWMMPSTTYPSRAPHSTTGLLPAWRAAEVTSEVSMAAHPATCGDDVRRSREAGYRSARRTATRPSSSTCAGDLVGRGLDLVGGVAHRDAACRPLEHLEVVALVADRDGVHRLDAEPPPDRLERRALGDPLGVDVEPGAPAHGVLDAVEADPLGALEELLARARGVAQGQAGDRCGHELLERHDPRVAVELAVGEGRGDLEAHAELLDGDQRRREVLAQHAQGRARVEGHGLEDLVAGVEGRVETDRHRPVGADGDTRWSGRAGRARGGCRRWRDPSRS